MSVSTYFITVFFYIFRNVKFVLKDLPLTKCGRSNYNFSEFAQINRFSNYQLLRKYLGLA